jgi:hypothetical protein
MGPERGIYRSNMKPASPRMTEAPTEQEIDEPTGNFLRPRSDIALVELLAYLSRANWKSTAIVRQSTKFDRGGLGHHPEPATVSGLSERDCSHWVPHSNERAASQKMETPPHIHRLRRSWKSVLFKFQIWMIINLQKNVVFSATAARLYGNILVAHRFGAVLPGSTSHGSLSKLIPSDLAPRPGA